MFHALWRKHVLHLPNNCSTTSHSIKSVCFWFHQKTKCLSGASLGITGWRQTTPWTGCQQRTRSPFQLSCHFTRVQTCRVHSGGDFWRCPVIRGNRADAVDPLSPVNKKAVSSVLSKIQSNRKNACLDWDSGSWTARSKTFAIYYAWRFIIFFIFFSLFWFDSEHLCKITSPQLLSDLSINTLHQGDSGGFFFDFLLVVTSSNYILGFIGQRSRSESNTMW